ncbi:hypothetical protein [Chryseolinea lacunae]|uniref:FAS1 domain-containing protein n=1 Tax=Chryseolinea lacunae TaxID=2801331 RepID=A0ABS1KT46_9BACT|nr:hypothetical protein [Chryseolinea lacunae]MBL0742636.1 hypothetical protein [Chryseolinea lacunae]
MRHLAPALLLACCTLACKPPTPPTEHEAENDTIAQTTETGSAIYYALPLALLYDTLPVSEFVALFKEKERLVYNLPKDTTLRAVWSSPSTFRGHNIAVNDSLKKIIPFHGYAMSFREMKGGTKRITLSNEAENITYVSAITLDRFYTIIASAILTKQSGDVDVAQEADGKFVNDSTYLRTDVFTQYDAEGDDPPERNISNVKVIFHANGQIEEKVLRNYVEYGPSPK